MQPHILHRLAALCLVVALGTAEALGTATQRALRGAPLQAHANTSLNATVTASTNATSNATSNTTVNASAPAPHRATSNATSNATGNASAPAPHRARLDVGFASFEKEAVSEVTRSVDSSLRSSSWNDNMRAQVSEGVAALMKVALQKELKPLKQSIAKTWMVLPQDDQKNAYVEQLRAGFESTFSRTLQNIGRHANTSLRCLVIPDVEQQHDANFLLNKASKTLAVGILEDHCYQKANLSHAHKAAKPAEATLLLEVPAPAPPGQFCIPSEVHSLVRHLGDTESLTGMTIKFEARALAMVQQKGREQAHNKTNRT